MAKKKAQNEDVIVDVTEVYSKSEQFVEKNKKTLSIVLGGIALLFILFFAYKMFYVKPKQNEAVTELFKAQDYFLKDSLNLALAGDGEYYGTETVANEYSGTPAGDLANYMSAIAYRDNGDYQMALEFFEKCNFSDNVLAVQVLGNMGDMYVEMETPDVAKAAGLFQDAGELARTALSENYLAPFYLTKAAYAYMELENYSKAKEMLQTIADEYSKQTYKDYDNAVKLLASLNNK